jgi:hypothetical protein
MVFFIESDSLGFFENQRTAHGRMELDVARMPRAVWSNRRMIPEDGGLTKFRLLRACYVGLI